MTLLIIEKKSEFQIEDYKKLAKNMLEKQGYKSFLTPKRTTYILQICYAGLYHF
ncbi:MULTISPECIES: hypothetical protein [Paenibacillus]|uniref:hypothetical protein n=1 Tax=Paenibacillus TaxID=44249 RepID=UPI0015C31CEE|nr:hypothetical protein [Paenibacillus borealis]